MNNIKSIVAKNITELRQAAGLTQLDLAEKLNYSDKAVSKWERGESMPDISVLVSISDLFNVSLDYLIKEQHDEAKEKNKAHKHEYSKGVITAVSILLVWFIAVCVFVVFALATGEVGYSWLSFIYAIPVSAIVWLVLNSIWFNQKSNYPIISLLMWSFLLSLHLSILTTGLNVCLIYLIGVPAQIIIILWSIMKKRSKNC